MAHYRTTRDRIDHLAAVLGPPPWRSADVVAAGWTWSGLQRAVGSGALVRMSRGLVSPPTPIPLHALVGQLLQPLKPTASGSHDTAAELNEQWAPWPVSELIHATVAGQVERTEGRLRIHGSRLSETFVHTVDGVRVTTPARTAMDLGRGRSLPAALLAMDGAARRLIALRVPDASKALRLRDVPRDVLDEVDALLNEAYAEVWSWPGTRVLRQALQLVDPRSESPFESWSRAWLLDSAVPPFEVNAPVHGASGRLYFGDFLWRKQRLIGEADGVGKYGLSAEEQRDVLRKQREREDDLAGAGWRVVRWVTGERPKAFITRVELALASPGSRVTV